MTDQDNKSEQNRKPVVADSTGIISSVEEWFSINESKFNDFISSGKFNLLPTETISEKIDEEERKKKIENDSSLQDMELKKTTLDRLFVFLALETVAVFLLAFLQGFMAKGFYLEEWSFRILTSVTILQITTMLLVAVQHLFPQKKVEI